MDAQRPSVCCHAWRQDRERSLTSPDFRNASSFPTRTSFGTSFFVSRISSTICRRLVLSAVFRCRVPDRERISDEGPNIASEGCDIGWAISTLFQMTVPSCAKGQSVEMETNEARPLPSCPQQSAPVPRKQYLIVVGMADTHQSPTLWWCTVVMRT